MKTSGNNPTSEHRGSCRVYYAEGVCTCGAPLERERALRQARESQKWPALEQPPSDLLPLLRDVLARTLLALDADLEAAERKAKELGRLADDEGSRRMSAERERDEWEERSHRFEHRAYDAERDLTTAREALETLAGKRITDGEGWATWAKNVARCALRSLGEKA